jgi:hypothetical protein
VAVIDGSWVTGVAAVLALGAALSCLALPPRGSGTGPPI